MFSSTVAERRPDGTIIAATLDFARSDIPRPIQQSDPPKHTVKRRLAFEAFKPARLVEYKPMIARIIDELIDDFTADGEVEFVSRFATPLPARVIHNILGIPESDAHLAAAWGAFEGQATRYHTPERQAGMSESIRDMGDYLAGALTDRHENPRDDVLSDLVAAHARERGEFILPELVGDASNLFLGGIVTTSHMLGWTMWMLLDNAAEVQRATADETEMVPAIEESLRLEPPVPWTSRLALTDTEVAGVAIPHFPDADEFHPDRPELKDHLSFGLRTHFCIGAPLARLEGRMALQRLFQRLADLRLSDRNDYATVDSMAVRGVEELHLEFTPGG